MRMNRVGCTTSQMPREHVLATNAVRDCMRTDKKLGVVIRPPKAPVTAEKKEYLQILDALDLLEKAPVDEEFSGYCTVSENLCIFCSRVETD